MNWKTKLTSRKFWAAVVGFVVPLLTAFGVTTSVVTQVTAIIMTGAVLIAYIVGEGLVDASSAGATGAATGIPTNTSVSGDAVAVVTDGDVVSPSAPDVPPDTTETIPPTA